MDFGLNKKYNDDRLEIETVILITTNGISPLDGMAQNVLVSIPTGRWESTLINLCMFISCLFTYPIITPPLNEIVESSCKSRKP